MKNIKYLLLAIFIFVGSLFAVNAALPYESGMKSMTLITYKGEYWTRKITQNHTWMREVLTIISDKTELEEEITPKDKVTTVTIDYNDNNQSVTIKCYGENKITIDGVAYTVNYDGDVEQDIINAFSEIIVDNNNGNNNGNGEVSNPETSDNITTVLVIGAVIVGMAIVSYRKRKLS